MIKNIIIVYMLFFLAAKCFASDKTPYIQGSFNDNDYGMQAEGLLWINDRRYIKSTIIDCNYKNKKCNLITASFVLNGNLPPSLYPNLQKLDIIERNKDTIISKFSNTSYMYIDLYKKQIKILPDNYILYTNQKEINKILSIFNEE